MAIGGNFGVVDIKAAMEAFKMDIIQSDDPKVFDGGVGIVSAAVLNEKLKVVVRDNSELVHWIDVIDNYHQPGGFDFLQLKTLLDCENPKYQDLPVPLCPKAVVPMGTVQQIAILKILGQEDRYQIFKWFTFPQKSPKLTAINAAQGVCKMMNFGTSGGKQSSMLFHFLFEKMGGRQARTKSLVPRVSETKEGKGGHQNFMLTLTDEEVDEGFLHMMKAPTEPVSQLIWPTKALKNMTPLKGWPSGYVEKALSKFAMEGAFAKKLTTA
jgi:hypothetical protein